MRENRVIRWRGVSQLPNETPITYRDYKGREMLQGKKEEGSAKRNLCKSLYTQCQREERRKKRQEQKWDRKWEDMVGLELLMDMWRTCFISAFLTNKEHICVCVWERTKHIICHLIGLKQCRGRMPHCRAAQMNEKYVNASCEVHWVHCQTDNRQMVKYPVWSKSVQATSKLWMI